MRSATHKRWAVLLLGAGLVLAALPATASEGEHSLAILPTYALLVMTPDDVEDRHGVGLGASYRYGLTDFWSLTVDGTYALFPVGREGLDHLADVRIGATYTIDALAFVPWLGVTAGLYLLEEDGALVDGGVAVGAGLDYRPQRSLSVGVEAWYHALVSHLDRIPATLTVGVRLTWYFLD